MESLQQFFSSWNNLEPLPAYFRPSTICRVKENLKQAHFNLHFIVKVLNTTEEELVYEFYTSNINIYPAVILYGCVTFQVEDFQRESFSFFPKYLSVFFFTVAL